MAPARTGARHHATDGAPLRERDSRERHSLGRLAGGVVAVALIAVVGVGVVLGYAAARAAAFDQARATVRSAALLLAQDRDVVDGALAPAPAAALRARAERARKTAGLDFVVVMAVDGTRWTHPDPERVGEPYIGSIAAAQAGGVVVEEHVGTLGPSVRAVAPVLGPSGRPIALVAAGTRVGAIHATVARRVAVLVAVGAAAVAAGTTVASLVHRRVDRQAHGLGPRAIVRTLAQHQALLGSVRAGYLLVGPDRRVELCNDEAGRLLGLDDVVGRRIADLSLEPGLAELIASGRRSAGQVHTAAGRTVIVTQVPARSDAHAPGWVTTIADHTDVVRMAGVISSQKTLIDALRARAHEADNRLHTAVLLVELGRDAQAVEFATGALELSREVAERLSAAVDDAALVALLLGKSAQAHEAGVELRFARRFAIPATHLPAEDLVVILGNLVDNAVEAACGAAEPRWVEVRAWVSDAPADAGPDGSTLVVEVADSGPGLPADAVARAFTRGWTTKSPAPQSPGERGIGLALVDSAVTRLRGSIEVRRERGATFAVRLPLRSAAPPVPAGKEARG
ncbi:sensor histidine kinase [Xylanimonas ulmi]|uniref:Two-component system CitB family sensor kinase n=1 Tax=Xylanimonas ulmi TaxID=228973 RepID=A0A4Q7LZI3_9MICO|nr:ATP-binding protein [Xylanibacterium ulmi]RZS59817.1 two-component system CitB family sensor kinase [Xylanibacterium ulmi]